jgi:hypothetical protein
MDSRRLRREYLSALDRYDRAAQELRAALDEGDESVAVMRAHAQSGGAMADVLEQIEPDERRSRLSDASLELERARHAAQRLLYSILVAEGKNMSDVARAFGISRGLVSRLVNEQD